jgi:hypothetical protein
MGDLIWRLKLSYIRRLFSAHLNPVYNMKNPKKLRRNANTHTCDTCYMYNALKEAINHQEMLIAKEKMEMKMEVEAVSGMKIKMNIESYMFN